MAEEKVEKTEKEKMVKIKVTRQHAAHVKLGTNNVGDTYSLPYDRAVLAIEAEIAVDAAGKIISSREQARRAVAERAAKKKEAEEDKTSQLED